MTNLGHTKKRILVTGGAGFIGSHLVDAFVQEGHDVMVVDDLSSGIQSNVSTLAQLVEADIGSAAAADATTLFNPHVICHHAAQMDVRRSVADPAFDAQVNLVGLLRMMEAARSGGALRHVLFASSGGAMYGEQDVYPAPENHPVRAESPYGLSKAMSEMYLEWYHRAYGITYTALRYANIYGPRQNPHGEAGVVAIFSRRMLANQPVTIYGDGTQTRDYVFVGDVVRANMIALQHTLHGGFNVGTGRETDVNVLAKLLLQATSSSSIVSHASPRPGEQKRSVIDGTKLYTATGFKPETSLEEGLGKTVEWFKKT